MAKTHAAGPQHTNRLIDATSPYLLQHAHNPVDWYPWGDEALEKARNEDKPIFLSVGYSARHWCHVMERESFEDEEIAEFLNEYFVAIKVDREERPDIDSIYMAATQIMDRQRRLAHERVSTPALKPFYAGTYFPPRTWMGRPGFRTVLESITGAWLTRREDVLESAEKFTANVRQNAEAHSGPPNAPRLRSPRRRPRTCCSPSTRSWRIRPRAEVPAARGHRARCSGGTTRHKTPRRARPRSTLRAMANGGLTTTWAADSTGTGR